LLLVAQVLVWVVIGWEGFLLQVEGYLLGLGDELRGLLDGKLVGGLLEKLE